MTPIDTLKALVEALDDAVSVWRGEMEYRSCVDMDDPWAAALEAGRALLSQMQRTPQVEPIQPMNTDSGHLATAVPGEASKTPPPTLEDAYAEGRKDEREEAMAAMLGTKVAYYMHGRDQAAEFARHAGYPELASSIAANWAGPGWLPPLCASCGGSGDCEVFVQSGGSMPWNAGDGHDETVSCADCSGTGFERAVEAESKRAVECTDSGCSDSIGIAAPAAVQPAAKHDPEKEPRFQPGEET